MQISFAMTSAVKEFEKIAPESCLIEQNPKNPIYFRVKVDSWPYKIHYEFRYNNREKKLFVELHIEDDKYIYLKKIFKKCKEETPVIDGLSVEYYENRESPNFRKRPTLSIELREGTSGKISAQVMSKFIIATKEKIARAIRL